LVVGRVHRIAPKEKLPWVTADGTSLWAESIKMVQRKASNGMMLPSSQEKCRSFIFFGSQWCLNKTQPKNNPSTPESLQLGWAGLKRVAGAAAPIKIIIKKRSKELTSTPQRLWCRRIWLRPNEPKLCQLWSEECLRGSCKIDHGILKIIHTQVRCAVGPSSFANSSFFEGAFSPGTAWFLIPHRGT